MSGRLTISCSAPASVASETDNVSSPKDKLPSLYGIHAALR